MRANSTIHQPLAIDRAEAKREYMRLYCIKNKEVLAAKRKIYKENNKEKVLKWTRDWKRANTIKTSKWSREYYLKNTQLIKDKMTAWLKRNPVRERYHHIANSARRRKPGLLPIPVIQKLFEDNIKLNGVLTCGICIKPIIFGEDSLDHKTPLSRGGTHEVSNLHVTHRICNKKKARKTFEEYNAK